MNDINVWKDAVEVDGRVSLSIAWFKSEEQAKQFEKQGIRDGRKYIGGHFHNDQLLRMPEHDYVHDKHGKIYAVGF